ncbi:MAG: putative dehydrogenase [Limisphaerales bacterium]|jgi:predicted dehydrogenase
MNTSRRTFITSTAAASTAFGITPLIAAPGKKFRTAVIGSGWWGMNILREAITAGRAKVVGLCDCYERPLNASADEVEGLTGDKPRKYQDYEEMLRKERPEIVIIATPDHWHALPAIAALDAGAHVFLEKPTAHTVVESRAIVKAAQAANRVVQVGLHRRIGPHHVSGMDFLKSGKVGDIGMVRMFVAGGGGVEKPTLNAKPPAGMDWDSWCGPAPMRPYNRRLAPGGWRNFLDYSNGTLGDWGVHWLDQMLWWTDEKYPKSVYSAGGRPIKGPVVTNEKECTSDAPDTQIATYEFESFTATWEHRKYAGPGAEPHRYGCYFYGTKGVFHMGWRDGWTFYPSSSRAEKVHTDPEFDNEKDGHNIPPLWRDFIDAIDHKRQPAAEIEASHRSSVLPMLGMISYRLGRSIQWDGAKEQVLGDPEANKLLRRDYRQPWKYPV